jgi:hypothetical protein
MDGDAEGVESVFKSLSDFDGHIFLGLESFCEDLDDSPEFAQSDDSILGEVSKIDEPDHREDVVFAVAREGDSLQDDGFCIVFIEGEGFAEDGDGVFAVAGKEFLICAIDAFRCFEESFAGWVVAGPSDEGFDGIEDVIF